MSNWIIQNKNYENQHLYCQEYPQSPRNQEHPLPRNQEHLLAFFDGMIRYMNETEIRQDFEIQYETFPYILTINITSINQCRYHQANHLQNITEQFLLTQLHQLPQLHLQ